MHCFTSTTRWQHLTICRRLTRVAAMSIIPHSPLLKTDQNKVFTWSGEGFNNPTAGVCRVCTVLNLMFNGQRQRCVPGGSFLWDKPWCLSERHSWYNYRTHRAEQGLSTCLQPNRTQHRNAQQQTTITKQPPDVEKLTTCHV